MYSSRCLFFKQQNFVVLKFYFPEEHFIMKTADAKFVVSGKINFWAFSVLRSNAWQIKIWFASLIVLFWNEEVLSALFALEVLMNPKICLRSVCVVIFQFFVKSSTIPSIYIQLFANYRISFSACTWLVLIVFSIITSGNRYYSRFHFHIFWCKVDLFVFWLNNTSKYM